MSFLGSKQKQHGKDSLTPGTLTHIKELFNVQIMLQMRILVYNIISTPRCFPKLFKCLYKTHIKTEIDI